MKWTQRFFNKHDGTVKIVEPETSGDYWVTDGWYVFMGHYIKEYNGGENWGLYTTEGSGVIKHCIALDDMNFRIMAFCKAEYPQNFERFQAAW